MFTWIDITMKKTGFNFQEDSSFFGGHMCIENHRNPYLQWIFSLDGSDGYKENGISEFGNDMSILTQSIIVMCVSFYILFLFIYFDFNWIHEAMRYEADKFSIKHTILHWNFRKLWTTSMSNSVIQKWKFTTSTKLLTIQRAQVLWKTFGVVQTASLVESSSTYII